MLIPASVQNVLSAVRQAQARRRCVHIERSKQQTHEDWCTVQTCGLAEGSNISTAGGRTEHKQRQMRGNNACMNLIQHAVGCLIERRIARSTHPSMEEPACSDAASGRRRPPAAGRPSKPESVQTETSCPWAQLWPVAKTRGPCRPG